MTRAELDALKVKVGQNRHDSLLLKSIKSTIEKLRDAAVLPTTKAIYEEILELFDED